MPAKTISLVRPFFKTEVYLWSLSLFIPLFLNGSQIITGSLTNALLFFAARRLAPRFWLPLIILPSIGAVSHNLLFGPFTIYLIYFLPFIWLGNYFLLKLQNPIVSIIAKVTLLFLVANIFVHFSFTPKIFLTAMGTFQLITAIIGLLLSRLIISRLPQYG